jgi:hypothetical protein
MITQIERVARSYAAVAAQHAGVLVLPAIVLVAERPKLYANRTAARAGVDALRDVLAGGVDDGLDDFALRVVCAVYGRQQPVPCAQPG